MARARTIKPSFFTNEDLCELPPLARILFIGLWTLADRDGRLENRPKRIKLAVLPFEDVKIEDLVALLHTKKFITCYEVDGVKCIQINNFRKHQKPHPHEVRSDLPEMSLHVTASSDIGITESTNVRADKAFPSFPSCTSFTSDPPLAFPSFDSSEPQADSKPAVGDEPEKFAEVDPFPCVGHTKTYKLPLSLLDTLTKAFPNLDVLSEMRKAQAWCVANPTRRKTAGGMSSFLNNWLSGATNGPNRGPPRPPPPKAPPGKLSDQLRERMAKR